MFAKEIAVRSYSDTKKLALVRPDSSHSLVSINWIVNNSVTQYLGADFSDMTVDDEVEHLAGMITNEDCYSWMIELDGEIVGNIELNEIKETTDKRGAKAAALCTLIGSPKNWGQGLGVYAKHGACNWAFTEGGFELIVAKAYLENERSWKSLEKLGFDFEGIEADEINGRSVQWKVYVLRKSDWEELDWSVK
jgi:RimJ/RimL family protein N-acetyltransferase